MTSERVLQVSDYFKPNEGEPLRTVMAQTSAATIVAWHVEPGQSISPHIHPTGQDTWTILEGEGLYFLAGNGQSCSIRAGDVAFAPIGALHGAINTGTRPLRFVSVVSPSDSGFELVSIATASSSAA